MIEVPSRARTLVALGGPSVELMIRGPAPMAATATSMSRWFWPPGPALALLDQAGKALPPRAARPWRVPKAKFTASRAPLEADWLSGTGPRVTARPVISSVAVLGVLAKVWGLKVRPPSMLAVR